MNPKVDGSDRRTAKVILDEIHGLCRKIDGKVRIMEVCGTHTVALRRTGVRSLLPDEIVLISGPGCPVCVTPTGYVDNALKIVREGKGVVATFGDMMKVPGSDGVSLSGFISSGAVRMVYSPAEILSLPADSDRPVVFLGIGFETTIPVVASVFLKLLDSGRSDIFLYTAFKTVVPALKALLADPDSRIDAFLLPGHVSVIIGSDAYEILEKPSGIPGVIAGFEPVDMLWGILLILRQIVSGENRVENAYPRAVKSGGNPKALEVIHRLLTPSDDLWRGLGRIPQGGLSIGPNFRQIDAVDRFELPELKSSEPQGCLCSEVIQGRKRPLDCRFFGQQCTPDRPIGPCMVSSEGTCSAYLRYGES